MSSLGLHKQANRQRLRPIKLVLCIMKAKTFCSTCETEIEDDVIGCPSCDSNEKKAESINDQLTKFIGREEFGASKFTKKRRKGSMDQDGGACGSCGSGGGD